MAIVDHTFEIAAPVSRVFAYVDDFTHAQDWMWGLTRLEPVGDQVQGVGTVLDGTMKLGVALKSRMEVIAWEQDRLIEMTSIKGITSTQRWEFTPVGDRTRLRAHITYELPGGPAGRAMAAAVRPLVGVAVHHTTETLKDRLEA